MGGVNMQTIYFDSLGESGNIFAVISLTSPFLSEADFKELTNKVFNSGSYEESLSYIREYVDLVDVSGEY